MRSKEWYKKHRCCPKCYSSELHEPDMAQIEFLGEDRTDDLDMVWCKCGWKGRTENLVGGKKVILEMKDGPAGLINFNMIFLDTGEIRQKQCTKEWLMKRVFFYELRTEEKNRGEIVEYVREAY